MPIGHSGTCFCGAIAIRTKGNPVEMGYCHCQSCRWHSGAPLTAYSLWHAEDVTIKRGMPLVGSYNKTGMSERFFCRQCGGTVFTAHPQMGMTDIPVALLPTLAFKPSVHLNYAEAVLSVRDGLPKLLDFPQHAGGSGVLLEE